VPWTPHLDELAAEGVVFPRAYVAGVRCKNSRRAMMHGRYQRHLQYLFENGGGGQTECPRAGANPDNRSQGCKSKTANRCNPADCQDAYALGRWANEAQTDAQVPEPILGAACVNDTCVIGGAQCAEDAECPGGYVSYAFAKTENMSPGQGGFDDNLSDTNGNVGKVSCGQGEVQNEVTCLAEVAKPHTGLRYGDAPHFKSPPIDASFDVQGPSLRPLVDAIDGRLVEPDTGGPVMVNPTGDPAKEWVQRRPFFIWFGPHMPHNNATAPQIFRDLYDPDGNSSTKPFQPDEHKHYGNVSWTDAVVGGLRYHLKRSCVCGAGSTTPVSLYENTVFLFLSDHGFLPFNSKGQTTEDGQRTVLIVSDPDDRADTELAYADRVFPQEIPAAIDLLPTIIEYSQADNGLDREWFPTGAGATAELEEDYPHGRPRCTA